MSDVPTVYRLAFRRTVLIGQTGEVKTRIDVFCSHASVVTNQDASIVRVILHTPLYKHAFTKSVPTKTACLHTFVVLFLLQTHFKAPVYFPALIRDAATSQNTSSQMTYIDIT